MSRGEDCWISWLSIADTAIGVVWRSELRRVAVTTISFRPVRGVGAGSACSALPAVSVSSVAGSVMSCAKAVAGRVAMANADRAHWAANLVFMAFPLPIPSLFAETAMKPGPGINRHSCMFVFFASPLLRRLHRPV